MICSPENVIEKNLDGHQHFIGCSLWKRSDPVNSHRFMSLPTDINECWVIKLFQNKGRINGQPLDGIKKRAQHQEKPNLQIYSNLCQWEVKS